MRLAPPPRPARHAPPAHLRLPALLASLLSGCAHQPPPEVTRADSEWIQPRLDEATRGAVSCVRKDAERVVEIELGLDGVAHGRVLPFDRSPAPTMLSSADGTSVDQGGGPGEGEATTCVEKYARTVPRTPPAVVMRSLFRGDGTRLDPQAPRARGLALRSRIAEQAEAVQRCAAEWSARHPKQRGRVGLHIVVTSEGRVVLAQVPASTLDELADDCAVSATRALRLPPIPGEYLFSYLFLGPLAFVGAPDVNPVDECEMTQAVDRIRPLLGSCFTGYRTAGAVIVRVRFGNDGLPINVTVEHGTAGSVEQEDLAADQCVRNVAARVRVMPFDGPPADRAIPFTLR